MQKQQRGYAIPLSLCVAGVTLFMGLSAAQLTTGDLNLATHQYYQERARQVAEYGLERCVVEDLPAAGSWKWQSASSAHPDDSVTVTVYHQGDAGCPVEVPLGFEYWVAEGKCGQGARTLASARVGAMVRYGHPTGGAGAQIRYFVANAEGGREVSFQVVDHLNNAVDDEVVISSEALGLPPAGAPPIPGLVKPVTLGPVAQFGGATRVPKGGSDDLVSYTRAEPITIDKEGGPLNVPDFTPPSSLAYTAEVTVVDSLTTLVPGRYGTLRLQGAARVPLNGTYHFRKIEVSPSGSTDLPQLIVESNRSARVFVDEVNQNGRVIELANDTHRAGNFRLTLKPVVPASQPPLEFKMVNGGEVALVAEGHALNLRADAAQLIKGSFACEVLRANFPAGTGDPWFVYDISGTTARRARAAAGGITPVDAPEPEPEPPPIGITGDREQPLPTDPGQPLGPGTPEGEPTGPGFVRAAGMEPMILSRQNL